VVIETRQSGAVTVIKPTGPIAQADAKQLKKELLKAQQEHLGRIVLDVSAVPFLDSTGLEALVDVAGEMSRSGQWLKLCSVNQTVRQILELTGLASQFEHFEDANSAVRSFL